MTIDPVQCPRRSVTLGVLSLSIVIIGLDPSILAVELVTNVYDTLATLDYQ